MFRRLRALITVISLLVPCGDSLSLPSALGGTLNAPNGDVMQYYGSAVSISGDGNTLAVGNIEARNVGMTFCQSGGACVATQKINDPNSDINSCFGFTVALDGYGDTLAVSAPYNRYVVTYSCVSGVCGNRRVINAPNSNPTLFGAALAWTSTASMLAVGAPDSIGGMTSAVYLYSCVAGVCGSANTLADPGSWTWDTTAPHHHFGYSLALSGTGSMLVVGDPGRGAVYVFDCAPASGTCNALPSYAFVNPETILGVSYKSFGATVDLSHDGTVVAVGSCGSSFSSSGVFVLHCDSGARSCTDPRGTAAPVDLVEDVTVASGATSFSCELALSPDGTGLALLTPFATFTYLCKPGTACAAVSAYTSTIGRDGGAVALSTDGTILAVGDAYNGAISRIIVSPLKCAPGSYFPGGILTFWSCTFCTPGYFQPAAGMTSCIAAQAGFYVQRSGSASETPCPAGTYSPGSASTACLPCALNFWAPLQSSTCMPCIVDECHEPCLPTTGETPTLTPGWCDIGGACTLAGTRNPASYCTICRPATTSPALIGESNTTWAPVTGGNCSDNNIETYFDVCTLGVCVGTPAHCLIFSETESFSRMCEVFTGEGPFGCAQDPSWVGCVHTDPASGNRTCGCSINHVCYPHGTVNPENQCQLCDVTVAPDLWTDAPPIRCNDGSNCTFDDTCETGGVCVGTSYACPVHGPCSLDAVCDGDGGCNLEVLPSTSQCAPAVDACTPAAFCDGWHANCPPPAASVPIIATGTIVVLDGVDGPPLATVVSNGATRYTKSLDVVLEGWSVPCGSLLYSVAFFADESGTSACSPADVATGVAIGGQASDWTASPTFSRDDSSMDMPNGTLFRIAASAMNIYGGVITICSELIVADSSAPSPGSSWQTLPPSASLYELPVSAELVPPSPVIWTHDGDALALSWYPFVAESLASTWGGQLRYDYAVLAGPAATPGSADFAPPMAPYFALPEGNLTWIEVPLMDFSVDNVTMISGEALPDGFWYAVALRGTLRTNISATTVTPPVLIDRTGPVGCMVFDGSIRNGSMPLQSSFFSSRANVVAQWLPAMDPESGILGYMICLGSSPGGCDVGASTFLPPNATSYSWGVPAPVRGETFFATLRPVSRSGATAVCSSTGQTFDDSPPTALVLLTPPFLPSLTSITLGLRYSAPVAPVMAGVFWLGTTSNGTDLLPPTYISGPNAAFEAVISPLMQFTPRITVSICGFVINAVGLASAPACTSSVADGQPLGPFSSWCVLPGAPGSGSINYSTVLAIAAEWSSSSAPISGIVDYRVTAQRRDAATNSWSTTAGPVSAGADATYFDFSPLFTAVQGGHYMILITAVDGAQATASVTTNVLVIDQTPPTGALCESIQPGMCSAWEPSLNSWSASWVTLADAESGIAALEVSLGLCGGAVGGVAAWRALAPSDLSVNFTGLALSPGARYCTSLRATNGAGLITALTTAGAAVDTSRLPTDGTLIAGIPNDPTGTAYLGCSPTTGGSINVSWSGWNDTVSGSTYRVTVYALPSRTVLLPTTQATTASAISLSCAALLLASAGPGATLPAVSVAFTAQLTVMSGAGEVLNVWSNTVVIDNSPPVAGVLAFGRFATLPQSFSASRTAPVSLTLSGFDVGASPIVSALVTLFHVGSGLSVAVVDAGRVPFVTFSYLNLVDGATYAATVVVKNAVGSMTTVVSNGTLIIDEVGPTCGALALATLPPLPTLLLSGWWPSTTLLQLRASAFANAASGLFSAVYSLGGAPHAPAYASPVSPWPTSDLFMPGGIANITGLLLQRGIPFTLTLRLTSNSGVSCTALCGPFIVDSNPPALSNVALNTTSSRASDSVAISSASPSLAIAWLDPALAAPGSAPVMRYDVGLSLSDTWTGGTSALPAAWYGVIPRPDSRSGALSADCSSALASAPDGRYSVLLRATAATGLSSTAALPQVLLLDRTPPTVNPPSILGAHGLPTSCAASLDSLSLSWVPSIAPVSGVAVYRVALSTLAGEVVTPWQDVSATLTATSFNATAAALAAGTPSALLQRTAFVLLWMAVSGSGLSSNTSVSFTLNATAAPVSRVSLSWRPACEDTSALAGGIIPVSLIPGCAPGASAVPLLVSWIGVASTAHMSYQAYIGSQPGFDDLLPALTLSPSSSLSSLCATGGAPFMVPPPRSASNASNSSAEFALLAAAFSGPCLLGGVTAFVSVTALTEAGVSSTATSGPLVVAPNPPPASCVAMTLSAFQPPSLAYLPAALQPVSSISTMAGDLNPPLLFVSANALSSMALSWPEPDFCNISHFEVSVGLSATSGSEVTGGWLPQQPPSRVEATSTDPNTMLVLGSWSGWASALDREATVRLRAVGPSGLSRIASAGVVVVKTAPIAGSISTTTSFIQPGAPLAVVFVGFAANLSIVTAPVIGYAACLSSTPSDCNNALGAGIVFSASSRLVLPTTGILASATVFAIGWAVNSVGLTSALVVSNAILADGAPPEAARASFDLFQPTGTRVVGFLGSGFAPLRCWGFIGGPSGISGYSVSVGLTLSGQQFQTLTRLTPGAINASGNCSGTLNATLEHGSIVHVTLEAQSGAGIVTAIDSGPLVVDLTPPDRTTLLVCDGLTPGCGTSTPEGYVAPPWRTASCSWTDASDPESGVAYYLVSMGTAAGAWVDDVPLMNVGLASNISVSLRSTMVLGTHLCVVTACNLAGLCTTVRSPGAVVDRTPPVVNRATATDGPVLGSQLQFSTSLTIISASWGGFVDPESGVTGYVVSAYDSLSGARVGGPLAVGLTLSTSISGLPLKSGRRYNVSVVAINGAGLASLPIFTPGVIIDREPPIVSAAALTLATQARQNQASRSTQGLLPYVYADAARVALGYQQYLSIGSPTSLSTSLASADRGWCVSATQGEVFIGNSTTVTVTVCAPGFSRHVATGACLPCAAGYFKAVAGDAACKLCPATATANLSTNAFAALAIVPGAVSTASAGLVVGQDPSSCPCPPGQTFAAALGACLCGGGLVRQIDGSCASCPASTFKAFVGDSAALCISCPSDAIPTLNQTSCACINSLGGIQPVFDAATLACVCPPGAVRPAKGNPCVPGCPLRGGIKTVKAVSGDSASLCLPCPWGTLPSADGRSCIADSVVLPGGTFNASLRAVGCAAGYALTGASGSGFRCVPCQPYTYRAGFLSLTSALGAAAVAASPAANCTPCPSSGGPLLSHSASAIPVLSARWDGLFTDSISGVTSYSIALGTLPGGTQVLAPTVQGVALAVTLHNLQTLVVGQPVFLTVWATDAAGNTAVFEDANPVVWDPSPPWGGAVIVGLPPVDVLQALRAVPSTTQSSKQTVLHLDCSAPAPSGVSCSNGTYALIVNETSPADAASTFSGSVDVSWGVHVQASGTALNITFDSFDAPASGLAAVSICVGSSPYACDVAPLTSAPQLPAPSINILPLSLSTPLPQDAPAFVSLWSVSNAGGVRAVAAPGVVSNGAPPVIGVVWDGTGRPRDADCLSVGEALSASWHGFYSPVGIAWFEWGVGSSPGVDDIVPFVDVGLAASASATGSAAYPLPGPTVYFSTVRAYSEAGVVAMASSNGVRFVCGASSAQNSNVTLAAACNGVVPSGYDGASSLGFVCLADGAFSSASSSALSQWRSAFLEAV